MKTISESLSCNLPRCKGTPERTTCGKKPTRRKGVTTVTEPAFAGKKRMRVRSIARAIVSRPIAPGTAFFPIIFSVFLSLFFFSFFPSFPFFIFFANSPTARAFPIRRSGLRTGSSVSGTSWTGHGDPASAPRNVPHTPLQKQ